LELRTYENTFKAADVVRSTSDGESGGAQGADAGGGGVGDERGRRDPLLSPSAGQSTSNANSSSVPISHEKFSRTSHDRRARISVMHCAAAGVLLSLATSKGDLLEAENA
jgi:hypothetical protein